jgi:4-hydroxybenzoate polyprenyltransferase
MRPLLPYLRLVRAGTLFSPGCDVVASLCVLGLPWSAAAVRAVLASILIYAAGMVWNDIADREEDARQRPERPLPRGDIAMPVAIALGTALLAGAILLSPCRLHHSIVAALVLAYDFVLKRAPLAGAVAMGTLNLLTAAALPAAPIWARWDSGAVDPWAWLPSVTQLLLIAAICYGVYILAVTILGIFEDRPQVRVRAVVAVQAAPPIAAVLALMYVQNGPWPAPALAVVLGAWFLQRIRGTATWDQRAIRRSMTYLLLGTMLFTALLALAADRPFECLAIAACIAPARWIARRISLT